MLEELAQIEDKEYTITKHEKTVYDAPVGSPTSTVYTTPPPSTTGDPSGGTPGGEYQESPSSPSEPSGPQNKRWVIYHTPYGGAEYEYGTYSSLQAALEDLEKLKNSPNQDGWLKGGHAKVYAIVNNQRESLPFGYRTGGYTGSWGPEGKMAMLHEKELVLNKDDTANFLAGINILR